MKRKKKRRLRFDRILFFLFAIFLLSISIFLLFNVNISNIYIKGNNYISDQEIIEIAELENYPSTLKNLSFQIKDKLKNNIYLKDVKVYKKWFTQVYIEVVENRPLFYYTTDTKTVLLDGMSIDKVFAVPTVLNYITDSYYKQFVEKMGNLDIEVLKRISEIKFVPNEVDDSRFLFTMTDGNYVYVDMQTFDKINKYLSILESLPDKNGILYLDYGNNFEIIK